ncbi:T9SS C-terminal target domain-containing protein [Chryseobacterium nematophagum]|uniref:T9SS C-terminal target domain-containing protein n=1 Tax=Chryseobacterium nematophagum TaxID=2305228 RepID=A0A3M7THL5_9FLAO|nr:M36 family metallopeptidase [Chryseobacterium nematophagum]RNA62778.1 T9SS C-terminal target domain-containing protein [Chryseobacterium nematophagum]
MNSWNILVNAETGEIVRKSSLMRHCNFTPGQFDSDNNGLLFPQNKAFYNSEIDLFHPDLLEDAFHTASRSNTVSSPSYNGTTTSALPDNASYNVFELPIESPIYGSRSIISNPWILSSSPEGWHSDGTNHYTDTRGNNATAVDVNGMMVDGGSGRNFDFNFNDNGPVDNNANASIVNMFYVVNRVHDILYQFGFTETAKNYQVNNFGHGGLGNDPVNVISFPFTNQLSFGVGPDGSPGGLFVGVWEEPYYLFYNTPANAVSRKVNIKKASFGVPLMASGITGDVLLSSIINACTPLPTGYFNNKIALIESGACDDVIKIKNAQNAGASAAILYENSPVSNITPITGGDFTVFIPSVKILNSEGEYIKDVLNNGTIVNVTLKDDPSLYSLKNPGVDNAIITHEYAHGLANRLTGSGSNCLDVNVSAEEMGEGWSDFYGMMLTNRPEYTAGTARGSGTYMINESTTGIGNRLAKYSPDFSINNYTYGKTNEMVLSDGINIVPNVHNIGFVWTTMLWDLHWKYAEKYGYSSDVLANTTNGSTRVIQLVTDALKLQACNPTFVDGRNAILAAEQATTEGEDKCMIWEVFAKRGLGMNASAGDKANIIDQVEDFTMPAECNTLSTGEVKTHKNTISIYPNPAKNEFYINFPSNTIGKVSVEVYDMSGKLVSSEDKISPDTKKAISTEKLINGTYMIRVKGLGFDATSKVIIKK